MRRTQIFDGPIQAAACPGCGYRLERAANPYGTRAPRPGAVCLCAGCGDALLFCEDMTLRAMTPDEWMAMPVEHRQELIRLRSLLAEARPAACAAPVRRG